MLWWTDSRKRHIFSVTDFCDEINPESEEILCYFARASEDHVYLMADLPDSMKQHFEHSEYIGGLVSINASCFDFDQPTSEEELNLEPLSPAQQTRIPFVGVHLEDLDQASLLTKGKSTKEVSKTDPIGRKVVEEYFEELELTKKSDITFDSSGVTKTVKSDNEIPLRGHKCAVSITYNINHKNFEITITADSKRPGVVKKYTLRKSGDTSLAIRYVGSRMVKHLQSILEGN